MLPINSLLHRLQRQFAGNSSPLLNIQSQRASTLLHTGRFESKLRCVPLGGASLQSQHLNTRHFSSSSVMQLARRPPPKDEPSIFGEESTSGFGGAVPVNEQQNKSTDKSSRDTDNKNHDTHDEDVYEVLEEKSSSIPTAKIFSYLFLAAAAGLIGYSAYNYENIVQYAESKWKEWRSPVTDVFLPPLPENVPYEQRKPVLVMNVDDLILHISYDGIHHGTRVQLRPHAGSFLEEMARYYEIVLFADSSLQLLMDTYQKLDQKYTFESHKLGSEYTTGSGRSIVKDLSRLGRPLSDVVFLEWKKDAYKFQPENTITLRRWKGKTDDNTLRELTPFLIALAQSKGSKDFRDILREWGNESVVQEDKDGNKVKKSAPASAEHIIQRFQQFLEEKQGGSKAAAGGSSSKGGWFSRLMGR